MTEFTEDQANITQNSISFSFQRVDNLEGKCWLQGFFHGDAESRHCLVKGFNLLNKFDKALKSIVRNQRTESAGVAFVKGANVRN